MKSICPGCRHNAYLRSVALAITRAIRVSDHVELTHCVDAQQLATGSSRSDVDQRCSGVLNAVEQEYIILRTTPADSEHVAHRRVRSPDPT